MSKSMLRRRYLAIAAAALAAVPSFAGKFYECTDPNGEIQYQQVACTGDAQQRKVHVYTGPRDPSDMSPSAYRPAGEEPALTDGLRFLARLSSALASLAPVKMAVTSYRAMHGAWPRSLDELGFGDEAMRSSQIEEVLLGGDGAIVARLNPSFGSDKRLVLSPAPVMDGTGVEWRCHANFPAEPMTLNGIALCESRALSQGQAFQGTKR